MNRKLAEEYDSALNQYDLLIMPNMITPADSLPHPDATPLQKMNKTAGRLDNTCPFSTAGRPTLAVPIVFVTNTKVPTNMQIVRRNFDEAKILEAAYAWKCATDWDKF